MKGRPFLIIVTIVTAVIIAFILLSSGFSLENRNHEDKEVIENMTYEELPEEVQEKIDNIKLYSKFGISKWEIDSKNKKIVIYAYNIRDEDEVNSLKDAKTGEWTFKVIHDINYEKELEQAWAVFMEMENDPALQISTFDMSSEEVLIWVTNLTPENKALDGTVILNRTIHVYVCATPPPAEEK